jgi:hypothetical protein
VFAFAAVIVAWYAGTPGAQAVSGPAERLLDAYTPIVMLKAQGHPPCDDKEEQYLPTAVHVVLGNPRVKLIPPPGIEPSGPVKRAPTAADIAGLPKGYHLDLPGNPLEPGCTYARDFAAIEANGDAPPITYAHIRRQRGETGLVVQYWFYWPSLVLVRVFGPSGHEMVTKRITEGRAGVLSARPCDPDHGRRFARKPAPRLRPLQPGQVGLGS